MTGSESKIAGLWVGTQLPCAAEAPDTQSGLWGRGINHSPGLAPLQLSGGKSISSFHGNLQIQILPPLQHSGRQTLNSAVLRLLARTNHHDFHFLVRA